MKEFKEEDFLNDIVCYAKNEISLKELIKKHKTDYRTMHNKITKLAETNPDIFKLVVDAHPYSEKKKKHIDFRALMIEIMKDGITVQEAADKYEVSVSTIQRRVKEISRTDPEFAKFYRKCIHNRKTGKENKKELREELSRYEYGQVIISDINEDRENELIRLKDEFDKLVESGISKNKAAKKLGVPSSQDMYKILKDLERIQIEKKARQNRNSNFKESLKVNLEDKKNNDQSGEKKENTTNQIQDNLEGRY